MRPETKPSGQVKRILDVTISAVGLIVTAPSYVITGGVVLATVCWPLSSANRILDSTGKC